MTLMKRFYRSRMERQQNEIAQLKVEVRALRARLEACGDRPFDVDQAVHKARSEAMKARRRWGVA
jgi:hypothetical protein